MRHFIYGFLVAAALSTTPALASHYFGHNSAGDQMERNMQQQERNEQQWERQRQEQFRQQRRVNPC